MTSPFAIFSLLLCLLLAQLAWVFSPLFLFLQKLGLCFLFCFIIYIFFFGLFVIFLNPFTAPACQISGLKSTLLLYTLYANSIFSCPVANPLWNWVLYVLMKIKSVLLSSSCRKEKGNKKASRFSNFTLFFYKHNNNIII